MTTHCGLVAVLGAPNAGKSTLVNRLVGSKVSIVTPKAQTTRVRVRGVCAVGESQLVFVDTPGIFDTERKFERGMVQEAWAGAADGDILMVMIDAERGLDAKAQAIIDKLRNGREAGSDDKRVILVLNKVDAVKKPYLLALVAACDTFGLFDQMFMISALTGDGVEDVKQWLAAQMPQGPWLYPADEMTDVPMRELAAEITREKLFLLLRQELPYSLKVEHELWEDKNDCAHISQAIVVERESQKKIVIGHGGEGLKKVGMSARRELEIMLGRKVNLKLFVKVDEKWKDR